MKLNRLTSCALAVTAAALACGCSTSSTPPKVALSAQSAAVDPNVTGTTNIMSAEMPGPKPKVGKAHLGNDALEQSADLDAPKEARRSDGSRRGGGFGSSK